MERESVLSSSGSITSFSFDGLVIRSRTSEALERYTEVKEWDNGYIVVMAKYSFNSDVEEEYIDLIPILDNLYIDKESFLKPIKNVKIQYA